jgi:hypothetical protein
MPKAFDVLCTVTVAPLVRSTAEMRALWVDG